MTGRSSESEFFRRGQLLYILGVYFWGGGGPVISTPKTDTKHCFCTHSCLSNRNQEQKHLFGEHFWITNNSS